MRTLGVASLIAALLLTPRLCTAQDGPQDDAQGDEPSVPPIARPTSGEPSLLSGRTLGTGEVMMAGAAGWPWIWTQLELAADSSFNVGIRIALLYGSPIMALEAGVGGEVSFPFRIHVFGEGTVDVAVFVTPAFVFAESAAVGEGGTVFAGDFGWSGRVEAGGVLGLHLMEKLTLIVGLGGTFGFVHTPDFGSPGVVGALFGRLGVEGLISRDTMLFALVESGVGFSPSRAAATPAFRESFPPMLRLSLGVAYLF